MGFANAFIRNTKAVIFFTLVSSLFLILLINLRSGGTSVSERDLVYGIVPLTVLFLAVWGILVWINRNSFKAYLIGEAYLYRIMVSFVFAHIFLILTAFLTTTYLTGINSGFAVAVYAAIYPYILFLLIKGKLCY